LRGPREYRARIAAGIGRTIAAGYLDRISLRRPPTRFARYRLLPTFNTIRLPGDCRATYRELRTRDGVVIPAHILAQLDKLVAALQIRLPHAR
jgi:hypothetical protein